MNQRATPPSNASPPAPASPQLATSGRDREFLPAALEILETPPPPVPLAIMGTICTVALAGLVWAYFGWLDVHAVAPGKIETAGHSKVIEPLDPGTVAGIHLDSGQPVKAGDLLLELDPAEANADARAAQDSLNAGVAEVARRRFAIDALGAAGELELARASVLVENRGSAAGADADASSGPVERLARGRDLGIVWDDALPEAFRLREEAVLRADLAKLADSLKMLDRQMMQKQATKRRLDMSIAFQHTLMDTLHQRVATRQLAIDLNVGTKLNLYDAREELERSQSQLASDEGQLIETDAALKELVSEKTKTISEFIADNQNKLAEASRKVDEARQSLAKATARFARTKLYAPIDGVVQSTAVTTVGQVVTTGQQLAVITPNGGKLQVEALVANLDIGFIKLGQSVVVKVDSFPFTRYGVVHGKVIQIAPAAIAEHEAKRALENASASANPTPAPATAPGQAESFVFPVLVELDQTSMNIDGAPVSLTPGMTVVVEIKTGSRRALDYVLSPLAKITSEAWKER